MATLQKIVIHTQDKNDLDIKKEHEKMIELRMDALKTINQVKSNRQPSGLNDSRQHNVICV